MRISLIIPSRNEPVDRLVATVASLGTAADEVIVVDDASDQPVSGKSLSTGVRLWRTQTSLGPSGGRQLGAAMSTGDVLLYSDAHVVLAAGDLRVMAAVALDRGALVQACCRPLVPDPGNDFCTYGATLKPREDGTLGAFPSMTSTGNAYQPCTGVYGSVYAIPRTVYDRLGGWPYLLSWGADEEALSLVAAQTAVPILVSSGVVCRHGFRNAFPYRVDWEPLRLDTWLMYHRLAEPAYWENYWRPLLESIHPYLAERGRALTDNCPQAARRREIAAARRCVADDVLWEYGRRLKPLSAAAVKLVPKTTSAATFHAARPWLTGRPTVATTAGELPAKAAGTAVAAARAAAAAQQPELVWH